MPDTTTDLAQDASRELSQWLASRACAICWRARLTAITRAAAEVQRAREAG